MIFIYNTIIQNLLMCLSIVLFLDPPFAKTGNSVNVYGVPRKHRLWISNDTTQCHNENICNGRVVPSSTTRKKQAGICLVVFGETNAQTFSVCRYSCSWTYLFHSCKKRRYHPWYDMILYYTCNWLFQHLYTFFVSKILLVKRYEFCSLGFWAQQNPINGLKSFCGILVCPAQIIFRIDQNNLNIDIVHNFRICRFPTLISRRKCKLHIWIEIHDVHFDSFVPLFNIQTQHMSKKSQIFEFNG